MYDKAVQEERSVIVHCSYYSPLGEMIRIWNSTHLVEESTGSRSKLLEALGITFFPVWMKVPAGTTARFTLFFAPLPGSCEFFNLFEDIPEAGGFEAKDIKRNKNDVYYVNL